MQCNAMSAIFSTNELTTWVPHTKVLIHCYQVWYSLDDIVVELHGHNSVAKEDGGRRENMTQTLPIGGFSSGECSAERMELIC
jgi:hypothetical protein